MWRKLDINSKPLINSHKLNSDCYNVTFTFMFLNNEITCDVFYYQYRGWLFLKYYCYEDKIEYYLTPRGYGTRDDLFTFLKKESRDKIFTIKCCDHFWRNYLNEITTFCCEVPEEWDYIYLKKNLISLSGHKLRSKRAALEKFLTTNKNNIKLVTLDNENLQNILDFFDYWKKTKNLDNNIDKERLMLIKLMENYKKLDCFGIIIELSNKTVAFTIGEIIDNYLLIHFEKADKNIDGLYVYINKIFLEQEFFSEVVYVNRQDDMGDPNLKRSKKSYVPEYMVEKFDITIAF